MAGIAESGGDDRSVDLGGEASHATVLAGDGGGVPAGGHPGKRH